MLAPPQPLTVHLPDQLYRRLQQTAKYTRRSLEELVVQTIEGNMPPTVADAPPELQPELLDLEPLNSDELWAVARSQAPTEQQLRQQALAARREQGLITLDELLELDELGERAETLTAKKAYAYALLRWRGFPLPTLEALESQL